MCIFFVCVKMNWIYYCSMKGKVSVVTRNLIKLNLFHISEI